MNILTIAKQAFSLILYLFLAFILIHFLAVFGVFLALAIPLLHLAFYPKITCFSCHISKRPHSFKHSLLDAALILLLTLLSIPIIYGETRLISYILSKRTTPTIATIAEFSIPARSQYPVGTIFPLPLELRRIPSAINVAQADLAFDPNLLEVVDITTDGTFAEFFVQKEFDNQKGYLRLSGGIPNPGYNRADGLIGTAYFRAKSAGATTLRYLESSLVLANDGRGTNLLSDYPTINLIITPGTGIGDATSSALTIKNMVQGDSDKTVLSFTEYGGELPKPLDNVNGTSTTMPIPTKPQSLPAESPLLAHLLSFNQQVLSIYRYLLSNL